MSKKVIISGGGTGGHVFPAIAIANALKRIAPETEILFVGAQGKLEMEKVPKAGYPIKGLWISGFHRKLTLRNLAFPFKLMSSLWKARGIVKEFNPDVAVGVGGYASGPTLEMAARAGVPILVQEQNSYPGVTNKILGKKASAICVSYDGMQHFFPKEKLVLTGNPVRKELANLNINKQDALRHFGLDENKPTIFIMGGSLGARSINDAVEAQAEYLKDEMENVQILWQAGKLYIKEFKKSKAAALPNVVVTDFIDRMDLAYGLADVVISRAGALSISELCLVGKPTLLVPSPNVAEDHQTKNAYALVEKEAALMVKDAEAKTEMIKTAIALLKNEEIKNKLKENIKKRAVPDADERIAREVLKLANKNEH